MSIRFYNPPLAIISTGNKEGVEIGGSLSILAMDKDRNLHTVDNIFSELSWGSFSKDEEIGDQIESITMKHEDIEVLSDPSELVNRLINAITIIKANNWIFFGIGDFEANSFMNAMCLDLDYSYVERLMEEQKRLRDQTMFPVLIDEADINKTYIEVNFKGKTDDYFHYDTNEDLFTIFNHIKDISGHATGIVCTSKGTANFYILNENLHKVKTKIDYHIDFKILNDAFSLMKKNKIFPISWFRIDLGLASLKTLEQWKHIRKKKKLKKALLKYFKYAKKDLKRQHTTTVKNKNQIKSEEVKLKRVDQLEISDQEKVKEMDSLVEILTMKDLGIFNGKKKKK